MPNDAITPALDESAWAEWRAYKETLGPRTDPVRDASNALQNMARQNDLLPDDSRYKITHATVQALRDAAACLEHDGSPKHADESRRIAAVLEALLHPGGA